MGARVKIRVLQAIRQGNVGGGESHLLSLTEALDKTKFDPVILSFSDGLMVQKLRDQSITCHVIPADTPFNLKVWAKVKKVIKQEQIDVVHVHGTRANTNIFWAAKSLKLPIIYTVHGWSFHDDQFPLIRKLRITAESFFVNRVNHTITVSESNRLTGARAIKKFQSVVINNGIDLNRFNPATTTSNLREAYSIPEDTVLIGYISRITKQKDPFTMLEAFARVLAENTNCKLLMVGDGDLKAEAVQRAHSLGIDKHVIFEGFRIDVPELLQAIDIYCLPSLWEGLPIGLLEAMAMEKAIVATRVDGSKELISHEKNGLLIEPQQPRALAEAILRLRTHPEFRKSLQQQTRKEVSAKYSVATMTRQVENLYQQVLAS